VGDLVVLGHWALVAHAISDPEQRPLHTTAFRLGLAEKTVKNYVSAILSKLEVARRAEAAAYLARHTHPPGS
jgi:hypothetical protein